MGILRLLLALSVLTAHSPWGEHLAGGKLAVEGFFIISGFYMALLQASDRYPTLQSFYLARWWRLWPIYLLALAATLTLHGHTWFSHVSAQSAPLQLLAYLANLFFVGLDGLFVIEWHGWGPGLPGQTGSLLLAIPPAWSLALELYFVALVPWLIKRSTPTLLALVIITQTAHIWAQLHGYNDTFWQYRFFPFEVGLFTAGVLAFRGWQVLSPQQQTILAPYGMLAWPLVATVLLWPFPSMINHALFLMLLLPCLPALFDLTQHNKTDRWLGDLSYPFYLWHLLLLGLVSRTGLSPVLQTLAAGVLTFIVSAASLYLVQNPVDRWRHRWAQRPGTS